MGGIYNMGKIWKLPDSSYFSGCGIYDHMVEIAEWLCHGSKEDKKPWLPENQESTFVIVRPDASCAWLTYPYLRPVPFKEPFFAIGSGSEYAMGALAAGAGARKACEIACRYDPQSGKGVDSIRVVPPVKKEKLP